MRSRVVAIAGRTLLATATVGATLAIGVPVASACSCIEQTPEAAIATNEIVFVGQLTDPTVRDEADWDGTWTFDLTAIVKGDLAERVVVTGDGWGSGCGTNYSALPQPTLVVAYREGDRIVARGCVPPVDGTEIEAILSPLRPPSGEGAVQALVALRHKWANLIALDGRGRVLSWGEIDRDPVAVAHCDDATAVVLHRRDPNLSFVDLNTMAITGQAELFVDPTPTGDLWCEPAGSGAEVWYASGPGINDRQVTVAGTPSGAGLRLFDDAAGAYIGPTGRIVVLKRDPGGPIEWWDRTDLSVSATTELTDTEAPIAGGFDATGSRLGVVVSTSGQAAGPRSIGSGVAVFDIGSDGAVDRADTIALEPLADAWPRALVWLDDSTLAVEYETLDSKLLDVVSLTGELISRTDIGWGWGDAVLTRKLLRSRNGGIELIGRNGVSTPLTPRPLDLTAGAGFVTSVAAGPVIPPLRPDAPTLTPVRTETEAGDQAPEAAVDQADSTRPEDTDGSGVGRGGRRGGLRRQLRDLAFPVGLGVVAIGIYLVSRRFRSRPEPVDEQL